MTIRPPSAPPSRTLSHAHALSRRLSFAQSTAWDTVTAGVGSHCPRTHSYHHYTLHAVRGRNPAIIRIQHYTFVIVLLTQIRVNILLQ